MSTSGQTLACLPSVCFDDPGRDHARPASEALSGDSSAMRRLRLQIERIGPHFRTVLVRGEMGTGKELVARALHERNGGTSENFVVCHAASLAEQTDDSRGDLIRRLMRKAGAGTLSVDGIEEMPLELQRQMLNMLEQRASSKIIASTTTDLRGMAAAGRFRQDLYHRLAMVEIVVEPLRRRKDEIPGLVTQFVKRFSALYERHVDAVAPGAMERLEGYAWPGNVRELENVVRNAVLQCEGKVLAAADLSSLLEIIEPRDVETSREAPARLQDVVEQHVLRVLRECSGNKVRAAEVLGISRSTLYRMLDGCSMQS